MYPLSVKASTYKNAFNTDLAGSYLDLFARPFFFFAFFLANYYSLSNVYVRVSESDFVYFPLLVIVFSFWNGFWSGVGKL